MQNYLEYVDAVERTMRDAAKIPFPADQPRGKPDATPDASRPPVLIVSPHPDDEMLVGALALRFKKQCGMRVVNLSATLGSKEERQAARWRELKDACDCIGFEVRTFGDRGLEHITPEARESDGEWENSVRAMAATIAEIRPSAVFFPHATDANRTHMGVHLLVMDALAAAVHPCMAFQTEFWAPMAKPNIVVESTKEDVAELITALSRHVGEVSRNPYHLRLPAWMMDNVRRGGELVGSQGGAVPDYTFATLYRREYWNGRTMDAVQQGGIFLEAATNPAHLLRVKKC